MSTPSQPAPGADKEPNQVTVDSSSNAPEGDTATPSSEAVPRFDAATETSLQKAMHLCRWIEEIYRDADAGYDNDVSSKDIAEDLMGQLDYLTLEARKLRQVVLDMDPDLEKRWSGCKCRWSKH